MYWLCLFCVQAANQTWLFYGYATPVEGFLEQMNRNEWCSAVAFEKRRPRMKHR